LAQDLGECAEHVVTGSCAPGLARTAAGPPSDPSRSAVINSSMWRRVRSCTASWPSSLRTGWRTYS
jgi:hypothetical protein